MIPYCLQIDDIKSTHLELWQTTCAIVKALPTEDVTKPLTCHDVCAIVASQLNNLSRLANLSRDGADVLPVVRQVSGVFLHAYQHSWLEVIGARIIIDPYPWAAASGPLLLSTTLGSPWLQLYHEAGDPATNPFR